MAVSHAAFLHNHMPNMEAGLAPVDIFTKSRWQQHKFHDLHVWEVTSGFAALSAHVIVDRNEDCHTRTRELERVLGERFGISHTTLQTEHVTERIHMIDRGAGAPPR